MRTAVILAAMLAGIPLGAEPLAGTLLVLNKGEATASLLDEASGEVLATLPTGDGPHEVAVSPDGRTAVACNYGRQVPGSTLTVIDVPSAQVTGTIGLGAHRRPHGIAWLDGSRVAVTVEDSRAVVLVDVPRRELLWAIPTGQDVSHMLALSPDGSRAHVANIGSGSMTVLDLVAGKKLADVQTGAGAEGIDVTPDGRHAWVTNRAADTVSVVDTKSLQVVATLDSPAFPIRAKATPDGRHVLVSNAKSGDLSVFDAKELRLIRRVSMTVGAKDAEGRLFAGAFGESSVPIGILVHPKGHLAWVAHAQGDVVSVVDLERWEVIRTVTAGREPDGLAYSPLSPRAASPRPRTQ